MKKFLLVSIFSMMISSVVAAAPVSTECAYSPLQSLIRDARDVNQINELIKKGVSFDESPRCGGTLTQLAVRRGNPYILQALLQQDLKRASQIVSVEEFPIPGAPKKLPLWLFAAYYAPNEQIIQLLQMAHIDIAQTDELGRNVLWYMERNPVLRKTALYDQLTIDLLDTLSMAGADTMLNVDGANQMAQPLTIQNTTGGVQEKQEVPSKKASKVVLEPEQSQIRK